MNSDKIFCLPYNGDMLLVKELIYKYKDKIFEFYGDNGVSFNSPRGVYIKQDNKSFKKAIEFMNKNSIEFNYTLNSMNPEQYLNNFDKYLDLINYLIDIGVKSIITSNPYFCDYIKNKGYNLRVSASTVMFLDCEKSIKRTLEYGFDRIVLSEDCNKRIHLIKDILKIIPQNIETEILIDNGCKRHCVNRYIHYLSGTSSVFDFLHNGKNKKYVESSSKYGCYMDMLDFITSGVMRRKDVVKYKNIGINLFKISGRNFSYERLFDFIAYYLDESSEYDNVFSNRYSKYINSEEDLDGLFDFLFEKGCNDRCSECGFCKQYAEKLEEKKNIYFA